MFNNIEQIGNLYTNFLRIIKPNSMNTHRREKKLLGIPLPESSQHEVLEQIEKYMSDSQAFIHVVSLNPENIIITYEDKEFKKIVLSAQISIIDGAGIVVASQILGIPSGDRFTGVDLMEKLMKMAYENSLSVGLIGAQGNLAHEIAKCYNQIHGQNLAFGTEGFSDIQNPTEEEKEALFSIVAVRRPRLLFVAFGSPWQEKWIYENRASLQGVICVGVGGAFDYIGGRVKRPHSAVRTLGLEWFYRLITQPWRWRRQLRLVKFGWLVFQQRFGLLNGM